MPQSLIESIRSQAGLPTQGLTEAKRAGKMLHAFGEDLIKLGKMVQDRAKKLTSRDQGMKLERFLHNVNTELRGMLVKGTWKTEDASEPGTLEEYASSIPKFNSKTPQQLNKSGASAEDIWLKVSIANATRLDAIERMAADLGQKLLKLENGGRSYGGVEYGSKRMSTGAKIAPALDKAITAMSAALKNADAALEASAFLTYKQQKALMRKGR